DDDEGGTDVPVLSRELQRVVNSWDGELMLIHHHQETGARIFIAIHDLTLGPGAGGTRIRVYPAAVEGLRDAMRLSEAMTSKWAVIGAEWGGGKGVLALPRTLSWNERRQLLKCYAEILNALDGWFVTAGDLGTTTDDLVYLATITGHVTAADQSHGESADSGVYTALGLRAAIRASLREVFGDCKIG